MEEQPKPSTNRRGFGRSIAAAALAGATGVSAARARVPEERAWVTHLSTLEIGKPVSFRYPIDHAAMVVRLAEPAKNGIGPDHNIVAFHIACPHMGCPLAVASAAHLAKGIFGPCSCHGSTFDLGANGRQLYGRASQDLVRVVLEIKGDYIFATGLIGLPFGEAPPTAEVTA
ncbi:MAG: arsenite oxidase small subunit [Myxococcota bacterium]|jgi:arsenite oxidase small subunit